MQKRKNGKHTNSLIAEQGGLCAECGTSLIRVREKKQTVITNYKGEECHNRGYAKGSARYDKSYPNTEIKENISLNCRDCHSEMDLNANLGIFTVDEITKQKQKVNESTHDSKVYPFLSSCPWRPSRQK